METDDILGSELAPPTPLPRDICVTEEEFTTAARVDDKLDAVGAALKTIRA